MTPPLTAVRHSFTLMTSTKTIILTHLTAVDGFASKEGAPAAVDPEINNVVNDEVNKFL